MRIMSGPSGEGFPGCFWPSTVNQDLKCQQTVALKVALQDTLNRGWEKMCITRTNASSEFRRCSAPSQAPFFRVKFLSTRIKSLKNQHLLIMQKPLVKNLTNNFYAKTGR